MAKNKMKVPKRIGGIKIRKRHRKQLRALVDHIDKIEELLAAGTALLAVLGIGKKVLGRDDKPHDHTALGKDEKRRDRGDANPTLAH